MTEPKKIEKLRADIRALQGERDALGATGKTRSAMRHEVAEKVNAWHAEALRQNRLDLRMRAAGHHSDLVDVSGPLGAAPLFALALGPDALTKALLTGIDAVPEGIEPQQRADRLAAISRELDVLEGDEEAQIEQLEAAGEVVYRRGDARPEIVLGSE